MFVCFFYYYFLGVHLIAQVNSLFDKTVSESKALCFCSVVAVCVTNASHRAGEESAGKCVHLELDAHTHTHTHTHTHCKLLKLINDCTHSNRTLDNPWAHLDVLGFDLL